MKKWFNTFTDLFFPSMAAYKTNDKNVIEYIENYVLADKNCRRICNVSLLLIFIPFISLFNFNKKFVVGFGMALCICVLLAVYTILTCMQIKNAIKLQEDEIAKSEIYGKLCSTYWIIWILGLVILGFIRLNCGLMGDFIYLAQICLGIFPLVPQNKFRMEIIGTICFTVLLIINLVYYVSDDTTVLFLYMFIITNIILVLIMSIIFQRFNLSMFVMAEYVKIIGFFDPLTGAFNRKGFSYRLKELKIDEVEAGIIMIDIDYFKIFNDTYGHARGDEILSTIAALIKSLIDTRIHLNVRYGGEEFVVCCIGSRKEETLNLAEKIKKAIADLNISYEVNGEDRLLSVSMGLDQKMITSETLLPELIDHADEALYYAKNHGRNQIVSWTNELNK